MKVKGYELLARALERLGVDKLFFLMGGPMMGAASACVERGIRMIDVRHEQSAALMAHAHARALGKPAFCMAAAGPGALNLGTGLAHALADCSPVVALGGAAPLALAGKGAFQEIDQIAVMRPLTKWAERIHDTARIPEYVDRAWRIALAGKPGPVYLDFPGDVINGEVDEEAVCWPLTPDEARIAPAAAAPQALEQALGLLRQARRPLLVSGGGILYAGAATAMREFVERAGIPFFTTPQGRGVIGEDHPLHFSAARSAAFREADCILVVGTRPNFVFSFFEPPRFAADAKLIRIDADPQEIAATPRLSLGIVGDAGVVLRQLADALPPTTDDRHADWRQTLARRDAAGREQQATQLAIDDRPIHPARLCREVRDLLPRDAVLVVDGQEILNFARQIIPSHLPGHRMNSGTFGTMGVGLPIALGLKAALPERLVVVLHGDGSFGLNGFELDTAVRHGLPVLVVISLNGGWSGDPEGKKVGRDLGYTRFDRIAEAFGCHAEYVEDPVQLPAALRRAQAAVAQGRTALVNVVTDGRVVAETTKFSRYMT